MKKKTIRMLALALILILLPALPGSALEDYSEIEDMLDALNGSGGADDESGEKAPSALDEIYSLLQDMEGEDSQNPGDKTPAPVPADKDPSAENPQTDAGSSSEELLPPEKTPIREEEPPAQDGSSETGIRQEDYSLLDGYDLTTLNNTVALQVPSGWGSNLGASDEMVSYSPANHSGATDPGSSTLSTIWYSTENADNTILDEYIDNIRKEDIFSEVQSEPSIVAGQEGVTLSYVMNVGINSFRCKSACFVYEGNLYTVEMYQGAKSQKDYFPVYENVISSEAIMAGSWNVAPPVAEPTEAPQAITPSVPAPAPQSEVTKAPAPPAPSSGGDLGDFSYTINGHAYHFPTMVSDLAPDDLDLDQTLELSYEADPSRTGDELINTLYFVLEHFPSRELAGVTNLTGAIAPMAEGVLTALVDTQASSVSLELPGGLGIGSSEASISAAFPEFEGRAMDGLAGFRGNDLLYACNEREDGCNGYVIIRNDAPFCSALSIICENGAIREINFQCLGTETARSIFEA